MTDTWIIAQLLAQSCCFFLLLMILTTIFKITKKWNILNNDEIQINLERRTFLVGAVLELVLLFQGFSLIAFLVTINEHIPSLLRGAMCATGALEANEFGYPLLYFKIGSLFVYSSFLFLHFLDKKEPTYPLTPYKYYLVIPAFLCVSIEFVLMSLYFWNINPDLIATCCSVSFFSQEVNTVNFLNFSAFLNEGIIGWIFTGSILGIYLIYNSFFKKRKEKLFSMALIFLNGILYIILSVYVLKFFFVKYIYGLPSHLCLFDIFFQKYNYIGYLIFFNLFFVSLFLINKLIFVLVQKKLGTDYSLFWNKYQKITLLFWLLSWLVPCLYYFAWEGSL
ncbi:hypothetical protein Fleli_3905 [Bernardetia litoralis DSM 6794]|uniref:Uncharacterized protein n=1 Tax=Bernardetia litoralis (strain ATCC 23117 / DSM 6794 / NBRC 15988 / NCIMB 1366 / Fx l1 / Sio-4) TaxID=880071 RepID=I4AQH3_BERLS|nr:hypothetical protein [Bernardetia litoralis]AFM06208.1 hypothetical protein Fleli_3905 [Bernardetia litoralis DSM 6794]